MIIKTTKDGSLYTDCSYQHNLAITCGECTTERISKALKRFEQGKRSAQEGVSIGDLSELPFTERESYISGYVAGIPATANWQAIKDANIARLNKSFYSYPHQKPTNRLNRQGSREAENILLANSWTKNMIAAWRKRNIKRTMRATN